MYIANRECGKANKGSRIVGGTETLVNEYPWHVGLVRVVNGRKYLVCGGSIISNHWVLTAAHCIDSNAIEVLVGDHDFTTGTETQDPAYLYAVNWKVVHPDYVNSVNGFDIALLHTTQPLDFTKYGQAPVCLPPYKNRLYVGERVTVSGWGTTSEGGSISPTLQEADLFVCHNSYCNQAYNGIILNNMVCAAANGKDSCQGDSGGPLVYNNNGIYELIGVVSFGIGCARPGYPGVYTRVTSHVDWIQRYTGNLYTATSG
ncbi:Tryptase-like [Homarus americanus]|uniref:Tryptase-like n=1 Tax=Homarus americanus TaxID=6706 RepID=A0A8J5JGK0_HOMAM|nr:Tryptase-like [Homarus americanus]